MNTAGVAQIVPEFRRFLHRHVLGLAPDPAHWPAPDDLEKLPLPDGIDRGDSTGDAWVLDSEHMAAWHRRRTAIGAHGYRFERNGEYDCGWRLVNVAARFISTIRPEGFEIVTVVPPPLRFCAPQRLAWLALRVADALGADFRPDLFVVAAPYSTHPDIAARLPLPLTDLFTPCQDARTILADRNVLLLDWRRRNGRTSRHLAHLLRNAGAMVTRLAWLQETA